MIPLGDALPETGTLAFSSLGAGVALSAHLYAVSDPLATASGAPKHSHIRVISRPIDV